LTLKQPPPVRSSIDLFLRKSDSNIMGVRDLILLRSMQRFPTRSNMKRARYGLNPDAKAGNIVDGFADTRSDVVKRMKIRQVLDFIELNRAVYQDYLALPDPQATKLSQSSLEI